MFLLHYRKGQRLNWSSDLLLYWCHILVVILELALACLLKASFGNLTVPRRFFLLALHCSQRATQRKMKDHWWSILRGYLNIYSQLVNALPPMEKFFQWLFLVIYKSFLFMFVWDAHVAFVGFTLQTTMDGINSSFKTQPGHLLWEASLDFSELNKAYSPLCHIISYPCFPNCCNLDSPGNTF